MTYETMKSTLYRLHTTVDELEKQIEALRPDPTDDIKQMINVVKTAYKGSFSPKMTSEKAGSELIKAMIPHYTKDNSGGLIALVNALVQWHGRLPDQTLIAQALDEVNKHFGKDWWQHYISYPLHVTGKEGHPVYWRGSDYATYYAAHAEGATYSTQSVSGDPNYLRSIVAPALDAFGMDEHSLCIAFIERGQS